MSEGTVKCWMWANHSDIVHAFEFPNSRETLCGVQKGFGKYGEANFNDPFLRKCKRCLRQRTRVKSESNGNV